MTHLFSAFSWTRTAFSESAFFNELGLDEGKNAGFGSSRTFVRTFANHHRLTSLQTTQINPLS